MKKSIAYLFTAALLFVLAACSPQLAKTKYGNVEKQWENYIHESYRTWEPPSTPPPMTDSNSSVSEMGSIDTVPEPVIGDNINDTVNINELPVIETISSESVDMIQPVVTPEGKTYTVQKGDTLWTISTKFYDNDGTQWRKIHEANKNTLSSPEKLKPGMKLNIPSN